MRDFKALGLIGLNKAEEELDELRDSSFFQTLREKRIDLLDKIKETYTEEQKKLSKEIDEVKEDLEIEYARLKRHIKS